MLQRIQQQSKKKQRKEQKEKELLKQRKLLLNKDHFIPDVAVDEQEQKLRKIATKGGFILFFFHNSLKLFSFLMQLRNINHKQKILLLLQRKKKVFVSIF